MKKIFFFFLSSLFLNGCASHTPNPISFGNHSKTTNISTPAIGVKKTEEIGNSIASKEVRVINKSLHIANQVQFNKMEGESSITSCALTVSSGDYLKRGVYIQDGSNAECFGPVHFKPTLTDGTTNLWCPGRDFSGDICLKSNGSYFLAERIHTYPLAQDFQYLHQNVDKVTSDKNIRQELIYDGKEGDVLKFIYREFTHSDTTPIFTQHVQFDLNNSNELSFKGVRVKVVSASYTSLEYILYENF